MCIRHKSSHNSAPERTKTHTVLFCSPFFPYPPPPRSGNCPCYQGRTTAAAPLSSFLHRFAPVFSPTIRFRLPERSGAKSFASWATQRDTGTSAQKAPQKGRRAQQERTEVAAKESQGATRARKRRHKSAHSFFIFFLCVFVLLPRVPVIARVIRGGRRQRPHCERSCTELRRYSAPRSGADFRSRSVLNR